MDLGTIARSLDAKRYLTFSNFSTDVRLVFANALTYNKPGSPYARYAKALLQLFDTSEKKMREDGRIPEVELVEGEETALPATKNANEQKVPIKRTVSGSKKDKNSAVVFPPAKENAPSKSNNIIAANDDSSDDSSSEEEQYSKIVMSTPMHPLQPPTHPSAPNDTNSDSDSDSGSESNIDDGGDDNARDLDFNTKGKLKPNTDDHQGATTSGHEDQNVLERDVGGTAVSRKTPRKMLINNSKVKQPAKLVETVTKIVHEKKKNAKAGKTKLVVKRTRDDDGDFISEVSGTDFPFNCIAGLDQLMGFSDDSNRAISQF
jgi:hypothetical protein